MAQITTHLLSAVDGRHAAGVAIEIRQRTPGQHDVVLATGASDPGGRFSVEFDPVDPSPDTRYELSLATAAYFADTNPGRAEVLEEIVVRFAMPDPAARYHMPLMIAPNSYSVWWSPPGG
ncbi:MAG: hydroxyisourate hydrolase [Pseudomonadota bacterium]